MRRYDSGSSCQLLKNPNLLTEAKRRLSTLDGNQAGRLNRFKDHLSILPNPVNCNELPTADRGPASEFTAKWLHRTANFVHEDEPFAQSNQHKQHRSSNQHQGHLEQTVQREHKEQQQQQQCHEQAAPPAWWPLLSASFRSDICQLAKESAHEMLIGGNNGGGDCQDAQQLAARVELLNNEFLHSCLLPQLLPLLRQSMAKELVDCLPSLNQAASSLSRLSSFTSNRTRRHSSGPRLMESDRCSGQVSSEESKTFPLTREPNGVSVSQEFNLQNCDRIREMLIDPDDRRILSIIHRFGCELCVTRRSRRIGNSRYRLRLSAPSQKLLKMCARALDLSLGWDLSSQLAYAAAMQK